ncbi:hypothetical protein [Burkholderia pseudomultivorans]|nr:hypothetical protein [Burkholderia pseudomultivorans]
MLASELAMMKAALGGFAEQATERRAGPWSRLTTSARQLLSIRR